MIFLFPVRNTGSNTEVGQVGLSIPWALFKSIFRTNDGGAALYINSVLSTGIIALNTLAYSCLHIYVCFFCFFVF